MPFIPNEKFKVGDWVYLKTPVRTEGGMFTRGTRVLLVSQDKYARYEFRDAYGNMASEIHDSCFTTKEPE